MATNNKRREATKRQLELQLRERQEREARRKRNTLIGSIVGSVLVIAVAVGIVVAINSGGDDKPNAGNTAGAGSTASAGNSAGDAACTRDTVSFKGVSVGCATDLTHQPKVRSSSTTDPTALEYKDLVVGKGKAASPTATVSVEYTGVLYKKGTIFDSSWAKAGAKPVSFSLKQVVAGFTQGIGGQGKIPPMKVGGRRIMILPSALGYGSQASSAIPANSSLVFVVDLRKVS